MTDVLSPAPKLQFFDNNGRPAVGYKLFTYEAGTSTKLATYTDSGGMTANANPTLLDYRGEASVWIPPNVSYKYVFANKDDTDPPTAPIWTVDNLVSSQLITLYGGVDTGSADAYVLNFTANFSSYQDGIIIYWIPSNTNTTVSTLNVNGLGAVAVVDGNGAALHAGQIIANQITGVMYRGGSFYLLSVSVNSGFFTGTLTGMTASVTASVLYTIAGGQCTLYLTTNMTGTSNTTAMTMTGVPSICRPAAQRNVVCSDITDNGVSMYGAAFIGTGGSIGFSPFEVSGTSVIPGLFTNSGTKGLNAGWTVGYAL